MRYILLLSLLLFAVPVHAQYPFFSSWVYSVSAPDDVSWTVRVDGGAWGQNGTGAGSGSFGFPLSWNDRTRSLSIDYSSAVSYIVTTDGPTSHTFTPDSLTATTNFTLSFHRLDYTVIAAEGVPWSFELAYYNMWGWVNLQTISGTGGTTASLPFNHSLNNLHARPVAGFGSQGMQALGGGISTLTWTATGETPEPPPEPPAEEVEIVQSIARRIVLIEGGFYPIYRVERGDYPGISMPIPPDDGGDEDWDEE